MSAWKADALPLGDARVVRTDFTSKPVERSSLKPMVSAMFCWRGFSVKPYYIQVSSNVRIAKAGGKTMQTAHDKIPHQKLSITTKQGGYHG